MGYTGPHAKDSTATKIVTVPLYMAVDVLSLGVVEAADALYARCNDACQKGLLEVCYDTTDSMLSARESLLPDSHALLDGCMYGHTISQVIAGCMDLRTKTGGSNPDRQIDTAAGAYCPNADLGFADAQLQIGNIYNHGAYGLNFDPVRAWVWYSLAAQGGNAKAAKLLSLVTVELTPEQQAEAMSQLAAWQPGQCAQELLVSVGWGQSLTTQYPSTISASTCMAWQAEKEEQ